MTTSQRLTLYCEGVRLGVAGQEPPNHYFDDRARGIADGRALRERYELELVGVAGEESSDAHEANE